tara:strand:+ start:1049 stop:3223 length:2175 start_codon:yes stop_codon:yes gene_type:complete
MSLIFTSNTQDEYDGTVGDLRPNIGIENPADYHNHLTSPLEVKPGSQIAVQSVKITRKAKWDFNDVGELLYYFGKPLGSTLKLTDVTSRPKLIQVPQGTYGTTEFASELQKQMKRMKVSPAVHQNFSVNTSFVLADFKGFEISCSQNGSTYTADIFEEIQNGIADVVVATTSPVRPVSNNFTVEDGVFSRTGTAGDISDGLCCGIMTDFPLAMGEASSFVTDFQGASFDTGGIGVNGNASWVIGLTRPTVQLKNTGKDIGTAPQGFLPDDTVMPHFFDYVAIFSAENGSRASPSFVGVGKNAGGFTINSAGQIQSEFDASADAVPSGTLKLYQGSYLTNGNGLPLPDSYKLHEILYYGGTSQPRTAIITNADILGSAATQFIKMEYSVLGDEVRVNMVQRNGSKVALLNSTLNNHQARNFKPTTDYTTALYPKMILSHNNSKLEISEYSSYSSTSLTYKYPTHTGYDATDMSGGIYTVGDSSYANQVSRSTQMRHQGSLKGDTTVVGNAPSWSSRGIANIEPPDQTYGQMLPEVASATNVLVFVGVDATTDGVNYQHLLVLENTDPAPGGGADFKVGNYRSERCRMGRYLGFPNIRVLDQSYGTLSLSNKQITWTSAQTPVFNVNSAFVRLSNLTQRSYNATKNSVSKMLYHIPRFTNDGRQFGDLFYEVNERTYVDLGNTDSFMLNQFQVSICDKNEKIVDDLTEDTIVVFHIRQKSEAGQYS